MTLKEIETADIDTPTGPMRTHLFRPAEEGRYPGVILYSEIFQVTEPLRRTAAFVAGQGYLVAAPEIYHELEPPGTALAYDEEGGKRGNRHKTEKPLSAYDDDARAVIAYLQRRADCTGSLGAMGFCIGGHLALRAAFQPEVRAAAFFYATDIRTGGLGTGGNADTLQRIPEINGEVMLAWGRHDNHISKEDRRAVYDALDGAGTNYQCHEFDAAHAFMRDEGYRYNPSLTQLCYALLLDLFHRRLAL